MCTFLVTAYTKSIKSPISKSRIIKCGMDYNGKLCAKSFLLLIFEIQCHPQGQITNFVKFDLEFFNLTLILFLKEFKN